MKQKFRVLLLAISALATAACESAKVENPVPKTNITAQNNQNSANNAGRSSEGSDSASDVSDNISNNNPNGNSNFRSSSTPPETADFAGTAGITDKKHQPKGVAVLKEVRAAGHAGYDRIVFEFEGSEMPSYHIEYIDKPVRSCGSGDVVPLKGDGWLEIRFTPAAAHTDDGKPTVKDRAQSPNLKIIREIKSTCDFEAEVEWVLGVSKPNKYRAMELKSPTRLAVDIKH